MSADPVVIASYARTPMGGFQGSLAGATATQLGAVAVRAAVERAGLAGEAVDQILMGCVLPAGLGQAPARQAALGAGLPQHVQATTVNKMCGSGMQAAILAHGALVEGSAEVVVAGGMESMSNAPYLLAKHRGGARIGHDRVIDSMYLDGLEDAYDTGKLMGAFAEETAAAYQFTRADMDAYAIESLARARAAVEGGAFAREILNVNGGACALGHPIGASGARILATLLAALEARGETRGLASLCIGGGEAVAMAVERF